MTLRMQLALQRPREDETRNNHRNAKQNPNRSRKTLALGHSSFENWNKRPRAIGSWFRFGIRLALRWPFRVSSSRERAVDEMHLLDSSVNSSCRFIFESIWSRTSKACASPYLLHRTERKKERKKERKEKKAHPQRQNPTHDALWRCTNWNHAHSSRMTLPVCQSSLVDNTISTSTKKGRTKDIFVQRFDYAERRVFRNHAPPGPTLASTPSKSL